MSTLTTPVAAAPYVPTPSVSPERNGLAGRWPIAGIVAGVAVFAFPGIGAKYLEEDVTGKGPLAVYDAVKDTGLGTHLSMDLAFVAAISLALFGTGFLRFLQARTPRDSGLTVLARTGLTAAVALSFLVAILKAVYRGGLPDHMDSGMYSKESVAMFQPIIDQLQYTGLWPLALTMAAVVALSLKHKALPRWYGIFTALVLTGFVGMALVLGLPYFSAIAGPFWLVASAVVVLRHR